MELRRAMKCCSEGIYLATNFFWLGVSRHGFIEVMAGMLLLPFTSTLSVPEKENV
jgi:hypothetical protein